VHHSQPFHAGIAGIVTVRTAGSNQKGEVVCTFERSILIAKHGYDVEQKAGY
jgi:acyl dehydratase